MMDDSQAPNRPGVGTTHSLDQPVGGLGEVLLRARRGPLPVESWNPPFCGDIPMRIDARGRWHYQGTPIERPAMVALFASILRRDPDRYVLVTPVERVGITVDDLPFVAASLEVDGDNRLIFSTALGDEVVAGPEHPLRFDLAADGGLKPAIHIRGDLWARLTRDLWIALADRIDEVDGVLAIRSGETVFPLAADALATA